MKAATGLTLLALVAVSSAASLGDENDERKRKIAEMSHHMSHHLRKAGDDLSQVTPAHTLRQGGESGRESRRLDPSVRQTKSAHAENIRRVAEQLGQHHQRLQAQAPELQQARVAQHSLANAGKPKMGRKNASPEERSPSSRDRKQAMQKLAEHMSHNFDPQAGRHEPPQHEVRTIRQFADHAVAPRQAQPKESSHVMGMQRKIARAAHQSFSAGPAKGERESKQANDGDE